MNELDPEAMASLDRWERTAAKLTKEQRRRIDSLVSDLGYCLRYAHGRLWLDLRANTLLAGHLYGVDYFEDPPKPKGRREAVLATRRKRATLKAGRAPVRVYRNKREGQAHDAGHAQE